MKRSGPRNEQMKYCAQIKRISFLLRRACRYALLAPVFLIALLPQRLAPAGVLAGPDTERQQHQALKDLSTSFSLMSVAAHPDDEDADALTLARMKWGIRASIVVSNYGEGGQNATGPELYEDMGALRYRELHAAASGYGVTRVSSLGFVDFGFSKTAEETFRFWGGKEEMVKRLVAAIRREKPMVIITTHTVDQGHGNHRAVAIALKDAFRLAGQPDYHPELGTPWKALRMFQTQQRPERAAVALQLDEVEPLTGTTYGEIARKAYLQHASQGPFSDRGRKVRYYRLWDSASPEILTAADNFFSGLAQPFLPEIGMNLRIIQQHYRDFSEQQAIPDARTVLGQMNRDLRTLATMQRGVATRFRGEMAQTINSSIQDLVKRLANAKAAIAGLKARWALEPVSESDLSRIRSAADVDRFLANQDRAIVGDLAVYRITVVSPLQLKLKSAAAAWPKGWSEVRTWDGKTGAVAWDRYGIVRLSRDADVTEPFRRFYKKEDLPQIAWTVTFADGATQIPFYWSAQPQIFPRAEMAVLPDRWLVWKDQQVPASVHLVNHSQEALNGQVNAANGNRNRKVSELTVAPASTGGLDFPLNFSPGFTENHQFFFQAQDGTLVRSEIRERAGNLAIETVGKVGLIRHTDSSTEEALKNLGISYKVITADELAGGDLSQYRTILVDHRSYVLVPGLVKSNGRLIDFARNGGNLVVFYQRAGEFNTDAGYPQLAPYPLHISSKRVTVEDTPVRILLPSHPLLQTPNIIGPGDFENWVQERGLYYPDKWDSRYQALLSSHDPDEEPLNGGLLVAPVGKGTYIYTSYVWYRQWRELNNGAFRVLANFLSFKQ
ncbi:MAG TPA: PIG-L family deacetylase [Acidobacteriota bacterium]|nr:PIG-L family deacetylase [Acidobacteriota bacterium]